MLEEGPGKVKELVISFFTSRFSEDEIRRPYLDGAEFSKISQVDYG